jgi:SPP1 family predicted phage head-tail adaptor
MRAGKLDREITVEARIDGEPNQYGESVPTWSPFATLRAQIVQGSTEEFFRAYGEVSETAIIFRSRYVAGVTTEHRVTYDGRHFNVKEVKEIGRRHGLELRCEVLS